MDDFGVIEVASARTTTAPGWAYVPDTPAIATPPAVAAATGDRKRAARGKAGGGGGGADAPAGAAAASSSDMSARQEGKIRRELEALDRDCHRDANVTIPVKNAASRAQSKHTPNVRKILLSQKTFANHLDDFEALAEHQPSSHPNQHTYAAGSAKLQPQPQQAAAATAPVSTSGGGASRRASIQAQKTNEGGGGGSKKKKKKVQPAEEEEDEAAAAAPPPPPPLPLLAPLADDPFPPQPEDSNSLLVSRMPDPPDEDELRRLLAAPPLTYLEAAARPDGRQVRYPARHFCEVCGYWGRVRCMKCGGRVCALDCLEVHREECITRYGL